MYSCACQQWLLVLTSSCCVRADADGNGDLDRDEMALVLKQMGRDVDDAGLDEIIREVDKDGDGLLNPVGDGVEDVTHCSGASSTPHVETPRAKNPRHLRVFCICF